MPLTSMNLAIEMALQSKRLLRRVQNARPTDSLRRLTKPDPFKVLSGNSTIKPLLALA